MKILKFLGTLLALQLVLPYQLLAHPVSPGSGSGNSPHNGTANAGSGAAAFNSPVNLNLSSTVKSMSLGSLISAPSVNINIGGVMTTLTSSSMVTAAEALAASEVAGGHHQTLTLTSNGNASSGKVFLGTSLADSITGLVVPAGVKLFDNANSVGALNLSGDLTNAGSFIVFGAKGSTASITAADIDNMAGGVISANGLNLNLTALNNLTNAGTISSGGNLSMSAGGTLTNAGGAVQAANNVNLFSGAGNIVNSGLVNAVNGNINLATLAANQLNINNANGNLQALNGAINLRDSSYNGTADTYVTGGNLLSSAVNVFAGQGTTYIDVNQLSGTVNATGYGLHILASTPTMVLGNINVVDPTFYNDDPTQNNGDIDIAGDISVGEDLTIIATRDIVGQAGTISITAQDGSSQGYQITLIAGAQIDVTNCTSCPNQTTSLPGGANPITGSIAVTGASSTGGNIDFAGPSGTTTNLTINSSSTGTAPQNGADVNLFAFSASGGGGGRGQVDLPTNTTITTVGNGTGTNGNVNIIAGGNGTMTNPAVQLGGIDTITGGGTGGGGAVNIGLSQPVGTLTAYADGSTTSVIGVSSINSNATLSLLGTINSASNVTIVANTISMGSGSQVNANQTGGQILFNPTLTGAITITGGATNGVLSANNQINFNGGDTNTGNTVSVNVKQITGPVVASGYTTNGTAVAITTAAGVLTVSSVLANVGNVVLTNNATGAANGITVTGTINNNGIDTFNLGAGATLTNSGTISPTDNNGIASIVVNGGGGLNFAGTGNFGPETSDSVSFTDSTSIHFINGLNQTLTAGTGIAFNTPIIIGDNGGTATINAGSSSISFTSSGDLTFEPVTAASTTTFQLNGVVTASGNNVSVNNNARVISSSSLGFTVGAGDTFTNNGLIEAQDTVDNGAIQLTIQGSGALNFAGSGSITLGNVDDDLLIADGTSITLKNGLNQVMTAGETFYIRTPLLEGDVSGTATIINDAADIQVYDVMGPLDIQPSTVGGGNTTTINLTANSVSDVVLQGHYVNIHAGTTINAQSVVIVYVTASNAVAPNGVFTNNGTLTSTVTGPANSISVDGVTGGLSLQGTTGQFTPGTGNTVYVADPTSILLINTLNQTVTNGVGITLATPIIIGQNSGTATITATGGTVELGNIGQDLTLEPATAGQTTNFAFNGSAVQTDSNNLNINSAANLASNAGITMNVHNGGTFTDAGSVSSTAALTPAVSVQADTNETLTVDMVGTGSITATAGGIEFNPTVTTFDILINANPGVGTFTSATTTNFNGGYGQGNVTVNVKALSGAGTVQATGLNTSITAATGPLNVSSIDASANVTLTATAGDLTISGAVISGGSLLTTSNNATIAGTGSTSSSSSSTFNVGSTDTFTNNGSIGSSLAGPATVITVQTTGSMFLNGTTGTYSMLAGNTALFSAPTSLTLESGLNQSAANGDFALQTPVVIGQDTGTETFSALTGSIAVNNVGGTLTLRPITAGQVTTVNLNAPTVSTSSNALNINSAIALDSNGRITFDVHNGGVVTENGTVTSTATLNAIAFQADPTQNLTVNMGAGSLLSATNGNVAFNPTAAANVSVTGGPTNGVINAANSISFNGGATGVTSVNVNSIGGAGAVTASGSSVSVTVAAGTLTVNGVTVPAAGGAITLTNNAAAGDVVLQSGLNSFGGAIQITAGRDIKVTNSSFTIVADSSTTNGGAITLNAGRNLLTGSISSTAQGATGNGGIIQLTSNSASAYEVGTALTNGVFGSITANGGSTTGNGGQVTITNSGSGGILVDNLTNLSVASGASGNGGLLSFQAPNGQFAVSTGNSVTLNGAGTAGAGGTFIINAQTTSLPGGSGFTVDAIGSGSGKGGTVSITISNGAINIGDPTVAGNIAIQAQSGLNTPTGNGGSVTLSTSGANNITVNASSLGFFDINPGTNGNGGTINFSSGHDLLVTGFGLSASGNGSGTDGSITLQSSDSTNSFTISPTAAVNGVQGDLTANNSTGGSISVTNTIGGISVASGSAISSSGTVTTSVGGGNLSNSGSIAGGTTVTLNMNGNPLLANANSNITSTGNGVAGAVAINSVNSITFGNGAEINTQGLNGTVTTDSATGALLLTVNSASGTPAEIVTNAGAINFNNVTALTVSGATGNELQLNTGGTQTITLNTTATTIGATGNNVELLSDSQLVFNVNNGTFTNNGIIDSTNGTVQDNILVASTGTLTVAGTQGQFAVTAGSNRFAAATSISFANGTDYTVNSGTVEIITPQVFIGAGADTGAVSATVNLSAAGGAFLEGNVPLTSAIEFSKLAGTTSGTLDFIGAGGVQVQGSGATIDANVTLEGNNEVSVTLNNGGTFTNAGTLAGTGSNSVVIVSINGAGTGTINNTGSITSDGPCCASTIILENTNASGTLVLTGSGGTLNQTNASAGFTEILAAGTLNFDNGMSQTVTVGSTTIQAPNVEIGANAGGAQSATLNGPAGAQIVIQPNGGSTLTFEKFAAATSAQFNTNVGTLDPQATTIIVNSGVILNATNAISATIGTSGAFNNAGTVAGASVTVGDNSSTTATINNTGTFQASGTGNSLIFENTTTGGSLTLAGVGGKYVQTNGTPGQTEFIANTTLNFANGLSQQVNGGGTVLIQSPDIQVGSNVAGAQIATLTATGAIALQANGTQTGTLTFDQTANQTSTTLNLNGGAVTMTANNVTLTANASSTLTVATNKALTVDLNDGGTLTSNGTLQSTLTSPATSITIADTNLSGTLGITLTGGTSAEPGQFDPSASNSIAFTSPIINISANAVQDILHGATVNVTTDNLSMGAKAIFAATGASTINITSPSNTNLVITAPDNTPLVNAPTISTNLGGIFIQPTTSGESVTFANSNPPGTGIAYINLNTGGGVTGVTITTVNPGSTTINADVNVVSDSSVKIVGNFNLNGSLEPTGPIFMCDINLGPGAFISTVGTLSIQCPASPPDLQITMADGSYLESQTGSILFNNITAGSVTITSTGPLGTSQLLAAAGQNVSFNGGATGTVSAVVGDIAPVGGTGLVTVVGSGTSFTLQSTVAANPVTTGSITASIGTASIKANGNININGTLQGPIVVVQTTGSNGNINIDGNVTSTSSASLTAFGSGNISQLANTITVSGTSVSLSSTTGSIGSATGPAPIMTAAQVTGFLTANTGGTGSVYISQSGSTQLGVSTAGAAQTFQVVTTNGGSLAINGGVTVTGGMINLTADQTTNANISELFGTLNVGSAGTINLKAGGDIGANPTLGGQRVLTSTGVLTAVAGGSAFLSDGVSVSLGVSSAGSGQTFDLLTSPGSNGNITINGGVTATNGTINLKADGQGTIVELVGTLTAGASGSVSLVSTSGDIGANPLASGLRILTATGSLTANTTGNDYLTDSLSVLLGISTAGGSKTFDLTTTAAGSITINGGVTGGTINLTANTTGAILETAGQLAGTNVNLASGTGTIGTNPGTGGVRIEVNAQNLTANTGNGGDVYIISFSTVNLLGSSAGNTNTFDLVENPGSNDSIVLASTTQSNVAAGTINLTADGSGSITRSGATSTLYGDTIKLISTSGTIGQVGTRINTAPDVTTNDTLTANTSSNVYLSNGLNKAATAGSANITLGAGGSSAGTTNTFDLITVVGTGGNIILNGNVTAGTINMTADGGITRTGATATLNGDTITLGANGGAVNGTIGQALEFLILNTDALAANTVRINTQGNVYVQDEANAILSSLGSTAGNALTFDFYSTGGTNSSIAIAGNVTAGTITLVPDGTGTLTRTGANAVLFGDNINLGETIGLSGDIGASGARIFVANNPNTGSTFTTLSSNTTGNTYLQANGNVVLGTAVLSSSTGTAKTYDLITEVGSDGFIQVANNVSAGILNLTADGTGSITRTGANATLNGDTITLLSNSGTIGQSGTFLFTNDETTVPNTLRASTTGNVYIQNDVSVILSALGNNAGNTSTYDVQTLTGSNGNIQIAGNITGGTVTLSADTGGAITRTGGTAIITADNVNLGSGTATGTIGQSGTRLLMQPNQLTATTVNANTTSDVYLQENGNAILGGANSTAGTGNTFDLLTTAAGFIQIANNVTAGTINLTANTTGAITRTGATATLNGNTINLASGSGNIGTGTGTGVGSNVRVFTATDTLTENTLHVNTTGNVYIQNANNVSLAAAGNTAGNTNTFDLDTKAASAGKIDLNGNVTAGTVNLTADTTGTILNASGTALITADTITLKSGSGTIGISGTPILMTFNQTTADTVTANTTGFATSNVYLQNAGNMILGVNSTAGNTATFWLTTTAAGNIAILGNVTAGTIDLTANTAGTITRTGTTATLAGDTIDLVSTTGNIGTGTSGRVFLSPDLNTQSSLAVTTGGNVYLQETGSVEFQPTLSNAGNSSTFDLLTTTNGTYTTENIIINNTVTAGTINLTTDAAGTITSTGSANYLSGNTINLTSTTTGNIGNSNSAPVFTRSATVLVNTVTANTGGNVWVENEASVKLGQSSAGNGDVFDFFTSEGFNGAITIIGNVAATGTNNVIGTIDIASDGTGGITQTGPSTLTATTVNLSADALGVNGAGTGSIGLTGSGNQVLTIASNLSARTQGSAWVQNTGSVTVDTSYAGTATGTASFNLNTVADTNGNGTVTIAAGDTITSNTINITSKSSGTLALGGINQADVDTTATLIGATINLTDSGTSTATGAGNIAVTVADGATTVNLSANTAGAVSVGSNSNVSIALASSAGNNKDFEIYNNVGTNTGVTVAANVKGTGTNVISNITLDTDGTGTITSTSPATLTATTVDLYVSTATQGQGTGNIGGSGSLPVLTAASNLQIQTQGSAWVTNTGNVTIAASYAGGGTNVFVVREAQGSNGAITIGGNIANTNLATTIAKITLAADGTGGIIEGAGSPNLAATEVDLSSDAGGTAGSGTGNIGGTGTAQILTTAPNLSAKTGGNVYVLATPTGGTVSLLPSFAGQTSGIFNLTTASGDNIAIDGVTSAFTVNLTAAGTGNITQTTGVVGGNNITLISNGGNIGTGTGTRVQTTAAGTLTIMTGGTGDVFVNQSGVFTLGPSAAGTGFNLTSTAGATIGTLSVTDGAIVIDSGTTATGNLTVSPNVTISATLGAITLQNSNTSGTLSIGQNSVVTSNGTGGGVNILIGPAPGTPTAGTTPANVTAKPSNGGVINFGKANTVMAIAPTNTVIANGTNEIVTFNNSNNPPDTNNIQLGGNVIINASATKLITSLDLNATTPAGLANVEFIQGLQASGAAGGKLVISNTDVVTGTLIVTPAILSPVLSAEDIPNKVTLTMSGFSNNNNVVINLTGVSSQPQVDINGIEKFVGGKVVSNSTLTIDSVLTTQPVLDIGSTGTLTSDGTLNVNVQGNMLLNGVVAAKTLSLSTTNGGGGTGPCFTCIQIGANVGMTGGTTSLTAYGAGTITNTAGTFSIIGTTVSLASGTGNIGTSSTVPLRTMATNITANTGGTGNIWLSNTGTSNLGASSAGGLFDFTSTGAINQTGVISGASVTLTSNAGITVNTNITATTPVTGTITLNTTGNGSINQAGGLLDAANLVMTSKSGSMGSAIATIYTDAANVMANTGTPGMVFIQDTGSVTLGSSSALVFSLTAVGSITTGSIANASRITLATGTGSNGNITINGNLGIAVGGIVHITTDGTGTINSATSIISGDQVYLTTGTAGIGEVQPISVNAAFLSVNTLGAAFVDNSRAVVLGPSVVGGEYQLDNAGTITVGSAVSADNVAFNTSANGSIVVNAALGQSGALVNLNANGSGAINGGALIIGNTVNLVSGTGSINSQTSAVNLSATNGGTASIAVSNNQGLILDASTSGGAMSITTTVGGLEIAGNVTAGTSLALTAASNQLKLDNGKALQSHNGGITLTNRNANAGTIFLDTNSSITAMGKNGQGSVVLTVGQTIQSNTSLPAHVTVNRSFGGQAYFGKNSIMANSPTNTLNVNANNITFSNLNQGAAAITLNGGVTITAEPIAMHSNSSTNEELVVDTGDDGGDAGVDGNQLVDALQ